MIILLNGSPRKGGADAKVLKYLSHAFKSRRIETKTVHVADLKLNYCRGCCECYRRGKCIYTDDIEELSSAIADCQGLVLASPTYAGNISGQLKTVIDRGHFVMEQLLYKKPVMNIVTLNYSRNSI